MGQELGGVGMANDSSSIADDGLWLIIQNSYAITLN